MWSMRADFLEKVQGIWNVNISGCVMFKFVHKLKQVEHMLKEINREGFSQIYIVDTEASIDLQEAHKVMQLNPTSIQARDHEQQATKEYKQVHAKYVSFLQ